MISTIDWIMPLLLLPGVGLLLLSTSARYGQLHAEVHQLFEDAELGRMMTIHHLLSRARLFRYSLTSLYASSAFFAVGGIAGAVLAILWPGLAHAVVLGAAAAGTICLLIASVLLVRESTLSLVIIESHLAALDRLQR